MVEDTPSPPALPRRGIGFHTAVAVNLVLLVGVAGFLAFDAARETRQREREKVAALDEEAMTLHQAVARLAHHSAGELARVRGRGVRADDRRRLARPPHRGRSAGPGLSGPRPTGGTRTTRCGPCGRPRGHPTAAA